MDVSRFLFKQETKDELQKQTHYSAGKLRWNKLKELEKDSSLASAKTRKDIVRLLGYDEDNNSVYNWVSGQVRKRYIVEQLTDTPGEYQYYTSGSEPHYDLKEQARKMRERKKEKRQSRSEMTVSTAFRNVRLTRLNKILELEENGKLRDIDNRRALSEALGEDYGKTRGWFSSMIVGGFINEANPWETPRYSLTRKALKEMSTPIKTVEVNPQPKTAILKPIAQPATTTDFAIATKDIAIATKQLGLTMTVHYGDLTIEFKGITQETINSLIDKLTNKAK